MHRPRAAAPSKHHVIAIATSLPGLESILSGEINTLFGMNQSKDQSSSIYSTVPGVGVVLPSPSSSDNFTLNLQRACLYLGTASNVRVQCGESFSARGLAELRRKTCELIDWKAILHSTTNLSLKARVVSTKSKLYHTGAIRERVLAGINDALGYKEVQEQDPTTTIPVSLDVRLWQDQVDVFVNSSATSPLHQRQYKLETAKAPLREDIAHAMLLAAGWKPSYGDASNENVALWEGLLDPMCGSGTIAIEGAAMAVGLPPGRLRECPFQGTVWEDRNQWTALIQEALEQHSQIASSENEGPNRLVSASDRDAGAVRAAYGNAKRAGVVGLTRDVLQLQQVSLSGQPWLEKSRDHGAPESVLLATNLPFGKRVSSKTSPKSLLPLYQTLGHHVMNLAVDGRRVKCVLLTDDPKLVHRVGLPVRSKTLFRTMHGGIPVTAMGWEIS